MCRAEIDALVKGFLGERRHAGQGYRERVWGRDTEAQRIDTELHEAVGFAEHTQLHIPGCVVTRSTDQVVAFVYSLSYAAPHLFGGYKPRFERNLRALLEDASPDGKFSEDVREIVVDIWRK